MIPGSLERVVRAWAAKQNGRRNLVALGGYVRAADQRMLADEQAATTKQSVQRSKEALLEAKLRDLQSRIDDWHTARAGKPVDGAEYQAFLREALRRRWQMRPTARAAITREAARRTSSSWALRGPSPPSSSSPSAPPVISAHSTAGAQDYQ